MENSPPVKRKFARHHTELPIEVKMVDLVPSEKEYLNDISFGGLSFKSKVPVKKDVPVHIKIPLTRPVFEAVATVKWCKKNGDLYDIGVEFTGQKDRMKIRMVQQICVIEEYKEEILKKEGRRLTGEQAALEWIAKFAADFSKENE